MVRSPLSQEAETVSVTIESLIAAATKSVLRNAIEKPGVLKLLSSWHGSTGAALPARLLTGAASPPPTATGRGTIHRWKPHELEVLLSVFNAADPNKTLPIRHAIEALGWASLPDPDHAIYMRVKSQLKIMRCRVQHGEEPLQVAGKRTLDKSVRWTAWIRAAVANLGDREFILPEIAAMLEADPDISPLLDRRPHTSHKAKLRWQLKLRSTFAKVPGIVRTGRKVGMCKAYRFDPTDPGAVPASRRRQPKKGVPGLPHLGRHEGSKGHTMAAAGQQQQQQKEK